MAQFAYGHVPFEDVTTRIPYTGKSSEFVLSTPTSEGLAVV